MICEHCGKNEVEILVKQMMDQEVKRLGLCRQCAEDLGFIAPAMPSITISFSLSDGAPRPRKQRRAQPRKREQTFDSLVCPVCGVKFSSFRDEGLLGCPRCYEEFRVPLGAYLQKTQGAESHWIASDVFDDIGLVSRGDENPAAEAPDRDDIARLRRELDEAVSVEDYERAAMLRDILAPLVGEGEIQDG
jgi:protein arginine kinase activator